MSAVWISKIAVGTDGSEPAMRAVTRAAQLAKQLNVTLVLIHVFTIDPARLPGAYVALPEAEWNELRDRYRSRLSGPWSAPCVQADVQHETVLVDGSDVAGGLIAVAKERNCSLIVAGRHGASGLRELLLGSTSYHLVHRSPIPVVIVPASSDE